MSDLNILIQAHNDSRYRLLETRLADLGQQLVEAGLVEDNPTHNNGQQYKGDTFTIRAYYWGDCICPGRVCPHENDEENCGSDCPSQEGPHLPECLEDVPNFQCQELSVWWYKYIGRAMDFTDVPTDRIRTIIRECEDEIREQCRGKQ